MRWLLLGGTAATIWAVDLSYTMLTGAEPERLMMTVGRAAGVVTVVVAVAAIARYCCRRLEAAIERTTPPAVELGRQLEQIRHYGEGAVVLPFRGRSRPMGR